MKRINVRTKQWRKHYRVVKALYDAHGGYTTGPVRIISGPGLIRHSNKLALRGKGFWLP